MARKYFRIERKKSSRVKGTVYTLLLLIGPCLEVKKTSQEGQKEHSTRFNWAKGRVYPSAGPCTGIKKPTRSKKEQ